MQITNNRFLVIISSNKAFRARTRKQAAKMRGAEEIRMACDPRDGCIVIIHGVFTCDIYKTPKKRNTRLVSTETKQHCTFE